MKINKTKSRLFLGVAAMVASLTSCVDDQSAGLEFMPDMYRSQAIEAYVDYGLVGENEIDSLKNRRSALHPPKGTIKYSNNQDKAIFNFPFEYPNTPEGREAASNNLKNPIKYSEEVAAEGERLYGLFCSQCHADDGNGMGTVVEWGNFPSPGKYSTKIINEGTIFHTITYGKGLMGSHASQLNKEERWKIVYHVLKLKNGGEAPVAEAVEADTTEKL